MNICLFKEDEINKPLSLRDERAEHILKILHKNEGDSFFAGIIEGMEGDALITKIERFKSYSAHNKKEFEDGNIYFEFHPQAQGKALYPLKMIIGFPRPIQLKRLLRDMAGLGTAEIHLTATDLGEKSYLKSDLANPQEIYKMLLEGTIQAAGTHVPKIFIHNSLDDCLKIFACSDSNSLQIQNSALFALDNIDSKISLNAALKKTDFNFYTEEGDLLAQKTSVDSAVAAIGSERGWSKRERELLEKFNFIRCRMGNRILRTETAATVAASLILNKMGFLD